MRDSTSIGFFGCGCRSWKYRQESHRISRHMPQRRLQRAVPQSWQISEPDRPQAQPSWSWIPARSRSHAVRALVREDDAWGCLLRVSNPPRALRGPQTLCKLVSFAKNTDIDCDRVGSFRSIREGTQRCPNPCIPRRVTSGWCTWRVYERKGLEE